MARTNRHIWVDSMVAHLGSGLEVKWYFSIALVASVCGARLALFATYVISTGRLYISRAL